MTKQKALWKVGTEQLRRCGLTTGQCFWTGLKASRPRPQQEMCVSSSTRKVSVLMVSIPDCITLPHGITPCCQMQKHRQSCCKTIAFLDQILTLLKISLKTCFIPVSLGSKLSPNTLKKVHYYQPRNYANKLLQSIGRKFLLHLIEQNFCLQRAGHVQKGLKFLLGLSGYQERELLRLKGY